MEKLVITLKQHTPIIHFQDDDRATLRASEVKPKLDKFIIEHSDDSSFEYWKKYLVGAFSAKENTLRQKFETGFRALNYKMRIEPIGTKQTFEQAENNKLFSLYFADLNNNPGSPQKQGVMYDSGIKLYITCYNGELKDKIEEYIAYFFECTNFGARQTKGYGSFYIKDEDSKEIADPLYVLPNHADYSFRVSGSLNDLFSQIKDFHSVIRAGINDQRGLYIKSALFKYLKDQNYQWDKRTIKQHFLGEDEIRNEKEKHPKNDIVHFESTDIGNRDVIFKELLGLSTTEKWRYYDFDVKRNHIDNDITRFKSPILFKPILESDSRGNKCYNVYIYLSDIPIEMRNQTFNISGGGAFNMTTSGTFNVKEYFKWIFQNKCTIIETLSTITNLSHKSNPTMRVNTIKTNFEQLTEI